MGFGGGKNARKRRFLMFSFRFSQEESRVFFTDILSTCPRIQEGEGEEEEKEEEKYMNKGERSKIRRKKRRYTYMD